MIDDLFLQPKEISQALIKIGEKKANSSAFDILIFGILAGVYIGFGGMAATTVISGGTLDAGYAKFLMGTVFSVGLMLVLILGAELFTGNILMMIGFLDGKYSAGKMFKNWGISFLGNFIGSILLALLVANSGLLGNNAGLLTPVGIAAERITQAKLSLGFWNAFYRGVLCNMLVCVAVIMSLSSKTVTGKIFGIYFPIMAFVLSGFEHSIANMYFIPVSLLANNQFFTNFWMMWHNVIPVTLGNIAGGLLIVLLHPKSEKKLAKMLKNEGQ